MINKNVGMGLLVLLLIAVLFATNTMKQPKKESCCGVY